MSKPEARSYSRGGSRKNEGFAVDRDEVTFIFFLKSIYSAGKKKKKLTNFNEKQTSAN